MVGDPYLVGSPLGCYGKGKVANFAEICAAIVLAGETSLSSAIIHGAGCRATTGSAATGRQPDRRAHNPQSASL
jgi:hypothetical protein